MRLTSRSTRCREPCQTWQAAILVSTCLWVVTSRAWAGPPLITDDPDTPGKGGWEINVTYNLELMRERYTVESSSGKTQEKVGSAREHALPTLDVNYGLLENDQWKIELPILIDRGPDGTYERGVGDMDLGWKYRFLDEHSFPVSLSIYPQAIVPTGDEDRGLGSGKPEYTFPLQVGRHFLDDTLFVYGEVGYTVFMSREEDDGWLYGIAMEYELFDRFDLVGEIHGWVPVTGPSNPDVVYNLGFKHELAGGVKFITAVGQSFSAKDGDGPEFIGFWGIQVTFGGSSASAEGVDDNG